MFALDCVHRTKLVTPLKWFFCLVNTMYNTIVKNTEKLLSDWLFTFLFSLFFVHFNTIQYFHILFWKY